MVNVVAGRNDQKIRAFFPGIRQCFSCFDAVSLGDRTFGKNDAVSCLFAAANDCRHRAEIKCLSFFAQAVHGFPAQKCIVDINVENDHFGAPFSYLAGLKINRLSMQAWTALDFSTLILIYRQIGKVCKEIGLEEIMQAK